MPKTPIEMMFDGIEWTAIPNEATEDDLPFATHHGVLKIGGQSLRCYRLNTGQAVFDCDDFERFFERMAQGAEDG